MLENKVVIITGAAGGKFGTNGYSEGEVVSSPTEHDKDEGKNLSFPA
jgi:hypothetical protein